MEVDMICRELSMGLDSAVHTVRRSSSPAFQRRYVADCGHWWPFRNMTWNGLQGFQTPIEDEKFLVDNMGVLGNAHTERGLTCECI